MMRQKQDGKGYDNKEGGRAGARNFGSKKPKRKSMEQTASVIEADVSNWKPRTELGAKVKDKTITDIDEILDHSMRIMEPEIIDSLLKLEQDLLEIGQSKGKFGGGARRVFRQTQKKTKEGNKPKFSTLAVVGDRNGHVGLGLGKAKETVPAREKAVRNAKLNLFKLRRGCGSWQCGCGTPHSLPFAVHGKCGSIEITLMPAPKGKGLCCQSEIGKILSLAGIKDVWTKTRGQTANAVNFVYACEDALRKLSRMKLKPEYNQTLAIVDGSIAKKEENIVTEQQSAPLQEEKKE
jgi:small subunit ribosomal protein S5